MSDLTAACANMGLDSRQLRPIAHATADGKVAAYVSESWKDLRLGQAMNLRDQLGRAIDELLAQANPARWIGIDRSAPARFDQQLRQWREGVRTTPPSPDRAAELERRALETLAKESTP
jgi:hypothetical protein